MITKLLSLLPAILRHPIDATRPQSAFQKSFEWQSEFLFVPEKRPVAPAEAVKRPALVREALKSKPCL